jgi:holo-[acyl-carrier protein] synthase
MIVGTGTDIVDVPRIRRALDRHGDRFLTRVFTPSEREYCMPKRLPETYLAARFAAKEAALKALGTGLTQGISWQDVEVCRNENGKPDLSFHNVAAEKLRDLGATSVHVSLSHTNAFAVAVVIIETGMRADGNRG